MIRAIRCAIAVLLAATAAHAADDLTVLKPGPDAVPPGRMLNAYLNAKAKEQFAARREAIAAIKSPEGVRERQAAMKARFLGALGGFPEKTPLNGRVVGADRRDGYRVERVIYESRPDFPVTAALYLPDGPPPFPAVLVPCGHSANGKEAEPYQRASILLAKNGIAALCFDPISQGERSQLLRAGGKPATKGGTSEHTMIAVGALLVGSGAATIEIWDGIRGLDYLESRPEIDASRLGCSGNSGGGTQTAYIMALDDRVAAAAPSCYITSLERLFATIGPQDAEQNINGQVAFGMDHADYVTMRAPKPTLIVCGTRDYFDIDGAWGSFREAKLSFGRLGFGERIDLFESDEPHGFTRPRREAATRFMRRWLLGVEDAIVEGDFPIAKAGELNVTETGQVLSAIPGAVSAFDLNRERAEALAKGRKPLAPEALRAEVRERLALPAVRPPIPSGEGPEMNGLVSLRDRFAVELRAEVTEPGIEVPLVLFNPLEPVADKPMVVYIGADRALAAPGGPIETRAKAGQFVAMVDPRGMGETEPTWKGSGRAGAFGNEEKEAFLALHLGRPLLGQRVFDLLQVLRVLRPLDRPARFHLIGVGEGGPIALHAALLDHAVESVELERSLVSWSAVATGTLSQDQLASVVPGVLEAYDLPDLAAALAPMPLTIREPTDPEGKPIDQPALDAAYAIARSAYRDRGAADTLILRAGP